MILPDLLLGLIGDNIGPSRAPDLHRLAGGLAGLDVRYDRLVPRERGMEFDALFRWCAQSGYRGLNVTHPYKERAAALVRIDDPLTRAVGAVNTVLFEPDCPRGFNTDRSGFVAALRAALPQGPGGPVCLLGAGGAGKAAAFGLLEFGVAELRLHDIDADRAHGLARAVQAAAPNVTMRLTSDPAQAAHGAAGLVICTPVGMVGHPGTPLPRTAMTGAAWAFDAVYTPLDTDFLADAATQGLTVISGYELFFHQGVDAWALFSGRPVDPGALRAALAG